MRKIFELKIETDEDLKKAIRELEWQGDHALIRKKELIVEIRGGEEQQFHLPNGGRHDPAYA